MGSRRYRLTALNSYYCYFVQNYGTIAAGFRAKIAIRGNEGESIMFMMVSALIVTAVIGIIIATEVSIEEM